MTKLTLNVDREVAESAKRWARRHGTSVSRLVTQYLRTLDESSPRDTWLEQFHQQLQAEGYDGLGEDTETLRRRHIRQKYE